MLGVCYYPEQWPEELWASDAHQMKELGLAVVRIGEFAWSRLEPSPGHYEFDWFDRAIDTLVAQGLDVVIGTPTATPPKWLVDQHPEIMAVDPDSGRVRGFGSRRHYDFSSEVYRTEALRITEQLVRRYGARGGVVGWQTDNELCCHDTTLSASVSALNGFRRWCEENYSDIDSLNRAWGNVFWSMEYRHFDEIELPVGAVTETNPSHRLAYRRYSSEQVIRFHSEMVNVIREYAPSHFITHNFIPMKDTGVDNFALAAPLDFASYDSYPLGRTDFLFADAKPEDIQPYMRTGHPDYASYYHDQTRGISKGPFWIMEQQPGPVNWAPSNPRPAPGMVRLWSLEAFAHGAASVCFFRWRQAAFAQEQMHAGLLRPDQSRSEAWSEIETLADEIELLALTNEETAQAPAAIVVAAEGQWVSEIEVQGQSYDFNKIQLEYYSALRQLGVDVDFISPEASFDGYSLVVVPCLPILAEEFVDRCQASSAQFIFAPRTGAKTSEFNLPDNLPPGPLQCLIPIKVLSVETLRQGCHDPLRQGDRVYESQRWCESIELLNADVETLATYEDGRAAVVRLGPYTYMATLSCESFLKELTAEVCKRAGVETLALPKDLRIRRRGQLGFAFNYSVSAQSVPAPEDARFLIGGRELGAHDVAVWTTSNNN
ncbi:beta-galactosidase [Pseudomaricurvus alkylphenolicus]|uniref:beta-galactosidase n=1 Tax=Pseudomaricurvus alkylphenolicus TaxID=1306991 RepID=UPI00142166DB|nr:beta-galactosidase [Pseudomaricurvus alkylphenolicus]NIB44202.1 beta-galactosidase [Pseudomaricurvus alkylphenolicus]